MLAPVLMKGKRPVVLALPSLMADNFLEAYHCGLLAALRTGWEFTNSFIYTDKTKGIHATHDGMDIALLSRDYNAREKG